MKTRILSTAVFLTASSALIGQCTPPDLGALEGIIVEKYYVSDANDATDEDGGTLVAGSVTWRVFADLKPGYRLLTVFGDANNELRIETTTEFFNNEDRGEIFGSSLASNRLGDNTVALDSYITIGAASNSHWGVPKANDDNGSEVGGINNDGGSASIAGGLLVNADPLAGIPLTEADGLIDSDSILSVITIEAGMEFPTYFNNENAGPVLSITNGAWAILGGTKGPTEENQLLLGQFTTDGIFKFKLNFAVGIPDSLIGTSPLCKTAINYFATLTEIDIALGNGNTVSWVAASIPGLCFDSDTFVSTSNIATNGPQFDIFPNPTKDAFKLVINTQGKNVSYRLMDSFGRTLRSSIIGATAADHAQVIDISNLASGIYFVRTTVDGSSATKKIIKK